MKIILSPTKSMKRKDLLEVQSDPVFLAESNIVRQKLENYDFEQLKKMYKSSDKIINQTLQYYQSPSNPTQALNLYDGLVFKQLKLKDYNDNQINYLNDYVRILSAVYGVLSPSSLINEYRLDYLMNFEMDLYEYWNDYLENYFNEDKLIINLASSEFEKSIKHDNIVNIHFLTIDDKVQATAAKMARGDMLNYLITNEVKTIDQLKAYNNLDYVLLEDQSDERNIYFKKEQ